MEIFLRISRMEALNTSSKGKFNFLIYVITIIVIMVFIYFIYQFLYGSSLLRSNIINDGNLLDATKAENAFHNLRIPNIYEGGTYSINFWLYINDFKRNSGTRKHLIEIGPEDMGNTNFSTILIALGATTPTLLVRVDTLGNGSNIDATGRNFGITDCTGNPADCSNNSGLLKGFSKISDLNIVNRMKDNSLKKDIINNLFTPFTSIDENSLINSSATCDVRDIEMQTWVNVSVILSGKTLEIYLQGKLVKTCVYNNFFKVDPAGVTIRSLQDRNGQHKGFGGILGRIQLFNTELTPEESYKIYMAGQDGKSSVNDPLAFVKYIFTGTG